MKEPQITRKWMAAAKILGVDPQAEVPCPVCDHQFLAVNDIPIPESRRFERVLSCPKCHSKNILLKS